MDIVISSSFHPNFSHHHLYTTDVNHKIVGCNDAQAHTIGRSSSQEAIGVCVSHVYSSTESSLIINNNESILTTGLPQLFEEFKVLHNDLKVIYSSYKCPLKGRDNKFLGVTGISIPIEVVHSDEVVENKAFEILTPLQRAALYFILKDWSLINLSRRMNVSNALIELHVRHILLKLNCNSLSELKSICEHYSIDEISQPLQSFSVAEDPESFFLIPHALDHQLVRLTKQQSRCFQLLVQGYTAKEIAKKMSLSCRTIQHYTSAIHKRLGISSNRMLISHYSYFINDLGC